MKTVAQFVASLMIPGLCFAQSLGRSTQRSSESYVLQCQGVTSAYTSLKEGKPRTIAEKSTDMLRIVRRGDLLQVQVNIARYSSMDPQAKKALDQPDPYRIVAETGEGFVAMFVNGSTTSHMLTIDRSLSYGIWVESGFSFLPPQSEPISTTVSLACTKEKE
jgi:hypothetical protein